MTEAERKKFRNILEAKQAALSGSLCSREEIAIEKAPDTLDAIQLAGEREVAIRNLWIAIRICCGRSASRSHESPMAPSGSVSAARMRSHRSGYRRCRGRSTASAARKRWMRWRFRRTIAGICLRLPRVMAWPPGCNDASRRCARSVKSPVSSCQTGIHASISNRTRSSASSAASGLPR